jgi:uncharacterized lipoprotein YddW (UPF0748 family)
MGERYLKAEEAVILSHYPTSRRWKILSLIPGRTWAEIGVKARKMGIHRTKEAKGDSIREGRMLLKSTYEFSENTLLDKIYPTATHAELRDAFPNRTLKSIFSHARRRDLHRTKETKARQMKIGREEAEKKK